ncbi:MAG: phenylalanine--tRNA ligase subunit alpha [Nitrososphaerota archaeon]|jgi:phenylalanyl-tRNA synthetase alpha chain|nr:phenylalanine--tRNA ligase subunit alpha [Nitrososphaerota archaeon]
MVELRVQEHQVLLGLDANGGKLSVEQLMAISNLPDAAVMRSALTLQEKALLSIHAVTQNIVRLTDEGKMCSQKGLPERRLVLAVVELGGSADLGVAVEKAGLQPEFVQIALGWVLRKKWASYSGQSNVLKVFDDVIGGDGLGGGGAVVVGCDEELLRFLGGCGGQVVFDELSEGFRVEAEQLKKRKLVSIEVRTSRFLEITEEGRVALLDGRAVVESEVTQLSPELIVSGKWRGVRLQKYNIEAPVANVWPGKKHPYLRFLDGVREKLVNLGFQEMSGYSVETSLFNFDALNIPQDHPARELSDIYYVKEPLVGDVSRYSAFVERVRDTHEFGGQSGSLGWGYRYSLDVAMRLILRGHGTCLSARVLGSEGLEVPGKYFSIARVYRPEVVDRTHLSEFNQIEGIIVGLDLNLRDLLGVLGRFAMEIAGASRVRFRPDYFPFTEPSVELSAYKDGYGWIEFGGSGIFRPEVTQPLGVDVPVIAWGLGVDRLFMMHSGLEDIRAIFSSDLDWLRKEQVV